MRASPELSRAFGLAGLLLELELLGAVIPVVDLLGQPVLHRRLGLVDPARACASRTSLEVLRHDMGDGVALRLLLDLAADPGALGAGEDRLHAGLALGRAAGSRGRARSGGGAASPSASIST